MVLVLVVLAAIFLSLGYSSTDSSEDDLVSSMFNFDAALPVLVFAIVPFIKCDTNEGYDMTVDKQVFSLYYLLICVLFVLNTKLLLIFDRLDVLICFIYIFGLIKRFAC